MPYVYGIKRRLQNFYIFFVESFDFEPQKSYHDLI